MFIFIFVLLAGNSCKMPIAPEFKGISEFKLNRDNEDNKRRISVGAKVYNPNKYKVKLMAYDFQIYVDDGLVGEAHEKRKQVIPKLSTEILRFSIRTDMKKVMKSLGGLLGNLFSGKRGVEMKFKGTIRARALGIGKTIPIDFKHFVEWSELR